MGGVRNITRSCKIPDRINGFSTSSIDLQTIAKLLRSPSEDDTYALLVCSTHSKIVMQEGQSYVVIGLICNGYVQNNYTS